MSDSAYSFRGAFAAVGLSKNKPTSCKQYCCVRCPNRKGGLNGRSDTLGWLNVETQLLLTMQ
jgi:hypothetical protein